MMYFIFQVATEHHILCLNRWTSDLLAFCQVCKLVTTHMQFKTLLASIKGFYCVVLL